MHSCIHRMKHSTRCEEARITNESEKFTNVVGRREGRITLCSLKRCIEDPQSAVGSPEEYPCLERGCARCKAENVIRLRNVIEVFAQHYWLHKKENSIFELAQQL
jgi:hypothetical protein